MMPTCSLKRCDKVASKKLGVINTGEKYLKGSDRTWEETVYVCEKHYVKMLKKLGFGAPNQPNKRKVRYEK